MNIGMVAAKFHEEIMENMLEEAHERARLMGAAIVKVYRVPGSFDIPLFTKKLLERDDVEGVVTLGAIVKGETDHDQIIGFAVADELTRLSVEFGKPVALGITGPGQTYEQAASRIPRAGDIVEACVKMILELKK